jgi:hypothetical protein
MALELKRMKPWPPLPAQIVSDATPSAQRLRELMTFSRSLLPEPEGCMAVWVLCPLRIGDAVAYAQLAGDLLRHEYPFPWFHHIRIILRDDAAQPALSATLANARNVNHYSPDLGDETMEKALEEDASD